MWHIVRVLVYPLFLKQDIFGMDKHQREESVRNLIQRKSDPNKETIYLRKVITIPVKFALWRPYLKLSVRLLLPTFL
jgi:hypothetical protein